MRARVADHRERGYTAHSVKIDDDPALNATRIEASLADRRPGELFIVDANGGMTVEAALRTLRLLPPPARLHPGGAVCHVARVRRAAPAHRRAEPLGRARHRRGLDRAADR
jgi:hypothetical protein